MSELRELYQEVILDHNRSPRNFRTLEGANRRVDGYNPLCGDHYTVFLRVENDVIADVAFQGAGCAISKASASIMSTTLKGKTVGDAERIIELFQRVVKGEIDAGTQGEELGRLAAFAGVSEFPARVKCATLAWHTLKAALAGHGGKTISTE